MTLSSRNAAFKSGIAISSLLLLLGVAASIIAVPVYASMEATLRPGGFFHALLGRHFEPRLLAAHFSALLLALFSLLAVGFIHFFFEKTQAPEILFVAFFAASFAPEVLRLALPLGFVYEIPSLYLVAASRAVLFGRYFGVFSLFVASVYAAGLKLQQQRSAVMIVVTATFFLALGVPVDTQVWDSSLALLSGYASTFALVESGIMLVTVAGFFIAALPRGSREFVFIGAGSALALVGRGVLLRADIWAALPTGMALLVAGTWLMCVRLHRIYLWL